MTFMPVHIVAGSLALAAGAVALYVSKGGKLHRQSGMIFLWAMLAMTISAVAIGLKNGQRFNVSQGLLTCYLVTSAYLAVKTRTHELRWVTLGGALLACGLGIYDVTLGMEALSRPGKSIDEIPAPAMFVFGGVALIAAAADVRFMTVAHVTMRYRVGRHLCRMGIALWIATASFFLGQANFIPEPLRILPLLLAPVLLVFGATIYWFVRVMIRGKPWTSAPARHLTGANEVLS